ncbi:alpha/beta hydrolase [Hoyosella sp. YIM 151337]|uniref:alpha/beta fold hydrolase n=1 Tax=Hoyosella sp. YIM 151337 TaxID=2992742 RepID=UPI002235B649|nr:alpha/beta hydrolase [Hoyosella sp. YIM 151337]MCW4352515.1 alpha/beta hydrolase [Hoyosella sp. YIM 151337]
MESVAEEQPEQVDSHYEKKEPRPRRSRRVRRLVRAARVKSFLKEPPKDGPKQPPNVTAPRSTRSGRTAYEHDFRLMQTDRASIVLTEDHLLLNVREVGPPDAPLTIVFAHGFCLHMGAWHFQRIDLEEAFGDSVRMIFYDQRGHGQSGMPSAESCTISQLGRDLAAVISQRAPSGPLILVGHSMGGMTVLAFARQFPDIVRNRVIGVGLVATAANGLSAAGIARVLDTPAVKAARLAVKAAPAVVQQSRDAVRPILSPILKATSYGDRKIAPEVARFSEKMTNETNLSTMVNFLAALVEHDESLALPVLKPVPALVVCGDGDMVTPFRNSVAMAEALPHTELLRVPKAGHMVEMEQPMVVSEALERLVERSLEHARAERSITGVFRAVADRAGHRGVWQAISGRSHRG